MNIQFPLLYKKIHPTELQSITHSTTNTRRLINHYTPKSAQYYNGLKNQMTDSQMLSLSKFDPSLMILGKSKVVKPTQGILKPINLQKSKSLPSLTLRKTLPIIQSQFRISIRPLQTVNKRPQRTYSSEGIVFGTNNQKIKLSLIIFTNYSTNFDYHHKIKKAWKRLIWGVIALIRLKYSLSQFLVTRRFKTKPRIKISIVKSNSKTFMENTPIMKKLFQNKDNQVQNRNVHNLMMLKRQQPNTSRKKSNSDIYVEKNKNFTINQFLNNQLACLNMIGRKPQTLPYKETLIKFQRRYLKKQKNELLTEEDIRLTSKTFYSINAIQKDFSRARQQTPYGREISNYYDQTRLNTKSYVQQGRMQQTIEISHQRDVDKLKNNELNRSQSLGHIRKCNTSEHHSRVSILKKQLKKVSDLQNITDGILVSPKQCNYLTKF